MIGVIGGTFDPIHFGHLRPALEISEALGLDELRFIPSANPPHRWQPEASANDRLAMVKLATQNYKRFVVDDREYRRKGSSYTVDTLESIRADIGESKPLCMVIGMDAFQFFTKWRDWQKILDLTHIVISQRPGYDIDFSEKWMKDRLVKSSESLHRHSAGKLFFSEVTQLEISATNIRERILKGKNINYLTPESACKYIQEHKLYK